MRYLVVVAIGVSWLVPVAHGAEKPARPNILVIYADDQPCKTVRCYPESWPWVKTPSIDALAKAGVRFHGAYLGSWCMPSRASLLTGRHPHGIESMTMSGKYPGSSYDPKKCPFWPGLFRAAGYHTAQIGKWHTGTDTGHGRDWDHQIVWNRPKYPDNATAYYTRERLTFNGEDRWVDGYPADNYTQWAVEYIEGKGRPAKKPWFLWLCYGNIHGPSTPPARHKGLYKDALVPLPDSLFDHRDGKPGYLKKTQAWRKDKEGQVVAGKGVRFENWVRQVNECVPCVDEGVGKMVQALKDSGQLKNTLIVYTADQGFAMGEQGMRLKIAPYDSTYRSPLIISMPGTVAEGKFCPQVANAPDLVATFFSLAGIKPPTEGVRQLHGRDLTPLLKAPDSDWPHACLYQHTGQVYGSDVVKTLRDAPEKARHQNVPFYNAVILGGWKYVRYLPPGEPEELYDLKTDPEELKNLAKEEKHSKQLARLRAALRAELERTGAPAEFWPKE